MAASLAHTYRYASPSGVALGAEGPAVRLVGSAPGGAVQPFVRATLIRPRAVALGLRAVSDVVGSRFHWPAAMVQRLILLADPVLTWGTDRLRVEGFSACCGIYARADLDERALELHEVRHGTTNVDFNAPMRAALARVRDGETAHLRVSADGVALEREDEQVEERKVDLPLRWLKGFGEVQAVQRRMEARATLDRASALRFLRGLPRSGRTSEVFHAVPAGRTLRLTGQPRPGSVRLAGVSRLRALEPLLPLAERLEVYEDPATGATAWRLTSAGISVTTVLSPEVWRGFSGEGQLVGDLATADDRVEARLRAALSWQAELSPVELASRAGLSQEDVASALARVAAHGLAGFDVARGAWFHRVLPYDLEAARPGLAEQNRRLVGARTLVEEGAVTLTGGGATVRSGDVIHRVGAEPEGDPDATPCTCVWWGKHQGARGPCKHVLATRIVRARGARDA